MSSDETPAHDSAAGDDDRMQETTAEPSGQRPAGSGPVQEGDASSLAAPGPANAGATVNNVTVVAVGTSVTWATGNDYGRKFPDLVHRDLNGGYPLDEKYLHYYRSASGPSSGGNPTPEYYTKTKQAGYTNADHPRGPHIPPAQYRARGGAIIGLSKPATVKFGNKTMSDITHNQKGGYFWNDPGGEYDGKVNRGGHYSSVVSNLVNNNDINRSEWYMTRDIGWSWPTIIEQMQQFTKKGRPKASLEVPEEPINQFGGRKPSDTPPRPSDVDLLIIDGGTNDMQLGWLNNPLKAARQKIWRAVRLYQYRNMVGKGGMLRRARKRFPNAVIVLVGAPIWASNRTNYSRAAKFLVAKENLAKIAPNRIAESAIDNALNFSHFSPYWLRRAVAEEARKDPGPGIVFAPPGYGIANAMMADWPWSYGYVSTGTSTGYSPDDVHRTRVPVCRAVRNHQQNTGEDVEVARVECTAAAIGHPNNEGCRQYADTIVRRFKEAIDLPVKSIAQGLDDSTDSLRRSLGRYGLDAGADGVRWTTSHRYVDSMKVKINTAKGLGMGRKQGEVYLVVYPGRTGNGERFRLDTESWDTRPGGPKPAAGRPKDEFYVDPMMDRWVEGDVGNFEGPEYPPRPYLKRNEPSQQQYKPGLQTRRLRLRDVEQATLETVGVDPGDGWDIEEVDFSINGSIRRTQSFAYFDNKDVRSGSKDVWKDREFMLANFNEVPGVTANDFKLEVLDKTIKFSKPHGGATLSFKVLVKNRSNEPVPGVAFEYGLRAKNTVGTYTGRNWQVERLGTIQPGRSKRPRVSLTTGKAAHIKRGNKPMRLITRLHVGGTVKTDYAQTKKSKI